MRHQSELETIAHDVFGPNDLDGLCDIAKALSMPVDHGHVFCYALQSSRRGDSYGSSRTKCIFQTMEKTMKLR